MLIVAKIILDGALQYLGDKAGRQLWRTIKRGWNRLCGRRNPPLNRHACD